MAGLQPQTKILRFLLRAPGRWWIVREMQIATQLNERAVYRALTPLIEANLVEKEEAGWRYRLNSTLFNELRGHTAKLRRQARNGKENPDQL